MAGTRAGVGGDNDCWHGPGTRPDAVTALCLDPKLFAPANDSSVPKVPSLAAQALPALPARHARPLRPPARYGDPYRVTFDEQNLLGLAASFLSLVYVLLSLASKTQPVTLSRNDGIVLCVLYLVFLAASLGTEIFCRLQDCEIQT